MNNLIKKIKKQKLPCYFISPHLDDAALSSGELMRYLSKITKVTVLNVFTTIDSKRETRMVKNTLKFTDSDTSRELYNKRKKKDKNALLSIKVRSINLDFVEAPWRKISSPSFVRKLLSAFLPEFVHIYPTYKFHIASGNISKFDYKLIDNINRKIQKVIPSRAIIFCPMGIGNHVDHLITREAVEKTYTPIYWVDQPYIKNHKLKVTDSFLFRGSKALKVKLISFYKTQLASLFPDSKITNTYERFVVNKSLITKYNI